MTRLASRRPKLPPLRLDPSFPQPVATPLEPSEKASALPCILVTPSSPTHEKGPEYYYFAAPEEDKSGLLHTLSSLFMPSQRIALPITPAPVTRGTSFSGSKRFRLSLLLAIPLFILLHLLLLPPADYRIYDIFSHDARHSVSSHRSGFPAAEKDVYVSEGLWQSNTFEPEDLNAESTSGHGTMAATPQL
ncbi:hypothetical protein FRC02_001807 [Tulasnella sp. 418]|nr:hypothetical protein FRC02_001807 [Tulasnella sp. 418]